MAPMTLNALRGGAIASSGGGGGKSVGMGGIGGMTAAKWWEANDAHPRVRADSCIGFGRNAGGRTARNRDHSLGRPRRGGVIGAGGARAQARLCDRRHSCV